ncbi:phenylalanine--tRNA ligase subunit alpha [Candidatus Beckwithbacteria bacterium RBG_13_42_9]|uniref:Phenylalanine--tRNA ligase alpha subunit n=1 Tax=Candidatus Beckwithbacteria bacterium RBG_13_42_9 TaxID=1797457 RepID=A0A1F5E5E1_9BACT|nr:MAG: phenylalanine--tRNA ligase subunit alpha [Candidatus Beckwithbacteria bacterium RBG_13_42_9]
MQQELLNLKNQALALINEAKTPQEIEELRIAYLGRKGKINELVKQIPYLSSEEKARVGKLVNEVKNTIQEALNNKPSQLQQDRPLDLERIDVTLPGKSPAQGHLHLVTQAIEEITDIFKQIGFIRVRYPEVDWDWYAFTAVNMPTGHPARDEWETFFVDAQSDPKKGKMLLTPHTSNGQVREMERLNSKTPIRMLNIAKCYRRQQDMTHTAMFHQFEGLVVDEGINITHLKGVLDHFGREWFGEGVVSRLRPFHFQFTEPSFEVDFSCSNCGGRGCPSCKGGWLEIGGAGMTHPNVLKSGGVDPKKYTGFAFGLGIERLIMLRYQVDNIRLLYENDLRFLEQF